MSTYNGTGYLCSLIGSDPFQEEKKLYYNSIVPFTGPRGWEDDVGHLLCYGQIISTP